MNLVGKVIAVDICNTIADVNGELEKRLGRILNPSEYFHPALARAENKDYFERNLDIFLDAKPIANSAEVLNELSIYNEIVYITARPQISEFVTKLWLKRNGYPLKKVYFTKDKVEVARKLNIDLAMDDAPFEIERYLGAGIEVLVKTQSYNTRFSNRFTWDEFKRYKIKTN